MTKLGLYILQLQGKSGTGANATETFWKKQDYCLGFIDPQSYNSRIPNYAEYADFLVGISFFWSTRSSRISFEIDVSNVSLCDEQSKYNIFDHILLIKRKQSAYQDSKDLRERISLDFWSV